MKTSEFFHKITSRIIWLNILCMAIFFVVLLVIVHIGLNIYTNHGDVITVPDVRKQSYKSAVMKLEDDGFIVVVNDTGYVKTMEPGSILEQMPSAGTRVKAGRIIYLTINASESMSIALPDVIDNCSLREAKAKLTSMGFKIGNTKSVPGEKDWIYGILVNGHSVVAGQRVSVDTPLTILVGDGHRDDDDDVLMTDAPHDSSLGEDCEGAMHFGDDATSSSAASGEKDDFEVVE